MDPSKPKNIFETVTLTEQARKQTEIPSDLSSSTDLRSTENMLQRCRKIHEEISKTLQKSFEKNNLPYSKYKNYVTDEKNFSQKDWFEIQSAVASTESQLKILSDKLPRVTPMLPTSEEKAPEPVPEDSSRANIKKHKAVSRRKWIRMQ